MAKQRVVVLVDWSSLADHSRIWIRSVDGLDFFFQLKSFITDDMISSLLLLQSTKFLTSVSALLSGSDPALAMSSAISKSFTQRTGGINIKKGTTTIIILLYYLGTQGNKIRI